MARLESETSSTTTNDSKILNRQDMDNLFNCGSNAESLLTSIDLPDDYKNQVIIITGANSGIGYETTRILCQTGATIIMACRNLQKSLPTVESFRNTYNIPENKLILAQLDLSDLNQIKQFVSTIQKDYNITKINTLICNAGVFPMQSKLVTKNGFELAFGVGHLGHMYLSILLKPLMDIGFNENNIGYCKSRIIMVSGDIYNEIIPTYIPDINNDENWRIFYDINYKDVLTGGNAYSCSKLCNIWFTKQFNKIYGKDGKILCVSLHPGVSGSTELVKQKETNSGSGVTGVVENKEIKAFEPNQNVSKDLGHLAFTQTWLAMTNENDIINGEYYFGKVNRKVNKICDSDEYCKKLWDISLKLIESVVKDDIKADEIVQQESKNDA